MRPTLAGLALFLVALAAALGVTAQVAPRTTAVAIARDAFLVNGTPTYRFASWGYFDYRMPNEGFDDGYQSVPVTGASAARERRRSSAGCATSREDADVLSRTAETSPAPVTSCSERSAHVR